MTRDLHTSNNLNVMTISEERNGAVSFVNRLSANELLTTAAITASPVGLVITNVAVNTVAIDVDGETCAIGTCVVFSVTATVVTEHTLTVETTTDAGNPQTLEAFCSLNVID